MPNDSVAHATLARDPASLADRLLAVRAATEALAHGLSAEDCAVQSMPDASPVKWHLAHTTWFFEHFVLAPHAPGYRVFDPGFGYLFNSYYEAVGPRHPRPQRGLLTRPDLATVRAWRAHVDASLAHFVASGDVPAAAWPLLMLGLHHEQQHQELVVTDLSHLFAQHPTAPAWRDLPPAPGGAAVVPLTWIDVPSGVQTIGHAAAGFAFDNEGPAHRVFVAPAQLASRAVSNGEYAEFVAAGGYRDPALWMSDGWATVQREGWDAPPRWARMAPDAPWQQRTVAGLRPLDPAEPVCFLSWFEADAYARFAGARLPTEAEWECVARDHPPRGAFADDGRLHPTPMTGPPGPRFHGDVWEWTSSAYGPYPGFSPAAGAVGEYNGKFMANQMVLRGSSCATPRDHARATYRNFFPTHARWQFSGVRLARDAAGA
ncbi:MAG: ergothioneine biosynthesis protein EgtB [Burkholderiales bacterium]|nr:ergothioneine biosynthesis protein EgtB [Burkholderiales bacterium]